MRDATAEPISRNQGLDINLWFMTNLLSFFIDDSHLEPSPSETWFRDMSEEGSFRRV